MFGIPFGKYPLHIWVELFSFLIAIVFLRKKNNSTLVYFIPFLFLTVLIEIGGLYIGKIYRNNIWLFNIFTSLEFVFYSSIFNKYFKNKKYKALTKYFVPFFIVLVIINLSFIQLLFKNFHSYTMIVGSFFIILFCCLYFLELFSNEGNILGQPLFWIACGLLLFYLGNFVYNLLLDYLVKYHLDKERSLFKSINNNLNILMYTLFSIGFYVARRK